MSLLLILTASSGCSRASFRHDASKSSNRIAILTYTNNDEFTNKLVKSMKASASSQGLTADGYTVFTSVSKSNIEHQANF